jgi:protein-tyrosine phosphatase
MNTARVGFVAAGNEMQRPFAVPVVLKRVFHAMRNLPDRMLHRQRYLAARARLSAMDRPRSMLVVCYGNICRSPYLEAVLSRAMPDVQVESAGFVGPGRPVPPFSLSVSAQRGLDLSKFRSRPLVPVIVRASDLIIVMDGQQARHIERFLGVNRRRIFVAGDLDPINSPTRAIVDPWEQPIDVFVSSFNRLDRCAATLVSLLM